MSLGDGLVNEAKHITSSLKQMRKQLEADIMQLGDASGTLQQDGDLIKDTYEEHSRHLKNALYSTKRRLISVKTAAILEKYSVFTSLLFFTGVVLYIVIKRTRVLVWLWLLLIGAWHGMFPRDTRSHLQGFANVGPGSTRSVPYQSALELGPSQPSSPTAEHGAAGLVNSVCEAPVTSTAKDTGTEMRSVQGGDGGVGSGKECRRVEVH